MRSTAGFLTLACVWTVILVQGLSAGSAEKRRAASPCRASCDLKKLAALTKAHINKSLTDFDKANGMHLGTWPPGFPELNVSQNSTPHGPKVQCSLIFMSQGLEMILVDQETNLNPRDLSLHKKLQDSISYVQGLMGCVKSILGGECIHKKPRPEMPEHVFERKQWSRTLLISARDYLDWLSLRVHFHIPKVRDANVFENEVEKGVHVNLKQLEPNL